MVGLLSQVDEGLAEKVAMGLGVQVPMKPEEPMNRSFGADTDPQSVQPIKMKSSVEKSKALSMEYTVKNSIKSRQIAVLIADGFSSKEFDVMKKALISEGALVKVVSTRVGMIKSIEGNEVNADFSFLTTASVLFDAVYIPGGSVSIDMLTTEADAYHFIDEAFRHCKAIAASGEGINFVSNTYAGKAKNDEAVILENDVNNVVKSFISAVAKHRNWERETLRRIPA